MIDATRSPPTRLILICAVLYALFTLAFLGDRPIKRVQEARVLETSRQMLAAPDWHGWLVPQLNGEVRLRKPPLCYWYTAAAFGALGVNEFAGRLPTLLLGWACIAVTYLFGRDLLGKRGALIAAATLASGHFFLRFIRSAETDVPAMLGVALACWAITRAVGINKDSGIETSIDESASPAIATHRSTLLDVAPSFLWFHLAAAGIALAAMSKGGPAIFPLAFLGLMCWALRSPAPAMRFVFSGAPLTALALIVPWFMYAMKDPAAAQVGEEILVVTSGSNHRGVFLEYIPIVLHMLLPWTAALIVAFFAKPLRHSPVDLPGRIAVCALMAVVLPLCVTLNVQAHYLVPTLPAFALVIAWTLTRALEAVELSPRSPAGEKAARLFDLAWGIAVWVAVACGPLVIAVKLLNQQPIGFVDLAAAVACVVAGGALWALGKGRGASRQVMIFATAMVLLMPIVSGWWLPTLNLDRGRQVAAAIGAQVGERPLIGWGKAADIALGFNMRREIRWLLDPAALRRQLEQSPDAFVVTQRDERGGTPIPADSNVTRAFEYDAGGGDILELYERTPSTLPTSPAAR